MGRMNGLTERYCFECKRWYTLVPKDKKDDEEKKDENSVFTCPHCEKDQRYAKCNRCGYEWKLHRPKYPENCPRCKNPYYNKKRIQERSEEESE